jgi:hypothetical protein
VCTFVEHISTTKKNNNEKLNMVSDLRSVSF